MTSKFSHTFSHGFSGGFHLFPPVSTGFLPGTEYYVLYLAWSASGEGRSQMGAIVPVGINRVDVWVDTPLEATGFAVYGSVGGANSGVFGRVL